jgi:hypothetical protein
MRRAAAPHGSPLRGRIIGAMFKCPPSGCGCAASVDARAARAQRARRSHVSVSFFERGRIASWRLLGPNGAQEQAAAKSKNRRDGDVDRSQTAAGSDRRALPEKRGDRLAQALLIACGEPAERLDDEGLLERGEHGLDSRGLEQLRRLPILDDELAEDASAAHLARDRHQNQIAARVVIGGARDDDAGALLGGGLGR